MCFRGRADPIPRAAVEDSSLWRARRGGFLCFVLCWGQFPGEKLPGTTKVWAVAQLCLCVHTPLCPQQCQRLIRDPRLGSPWPQQQAGADGSGENITGIPACLPMLPISLTGLGHQHSPREYETCVPSSAETRTTTWAGGHGGGLPCPWHTPAAGIPGCQHAGQQLQQAWC